MSLAVETANSVEEEPDPGADVEPVILEQGQVSVMVVPSITVVRTSVEAPDGSVPSEDLETTVEKVGAVVDFAEEEEVPDDFAEDVADGAAELALKDEEDGTAELALEEEADGTAELDGHTLSWVSPGSLTWNTKAWLSRLNPELSLYGNWPKFMNPFWVIKSSSETVSKKYSSVVHWTGTKVIPSHFSFNKV
ncbi:hypothetical protein OGAPHI_006881 [Ogataea philodendri]|uniref:Uncharacterized protein n=1 Tax=Ogataea philodendri TaxID=1378263 RepID=A0A9P8NVJ1_9ASCO|nr:uncharacterized protein OGAPHI_006881 [Ogataea philodendri]KAH3660295.1 hypothetical protein OGAPHI_006881 [Ogataea philodendri]